MIMKHNPFVFGVLSLALIAPAVASAQNQVFLNGIEISGTRNQSFENVTVFFDDVGNISITAPQYRVLEQEPETTAAVAPSSTQRAQVVGQIRPQNLTQTQIAQTVPVLPDPQKPTYLLALFNAPGLLGYNIEVSVNGIVVRTLTQGSASQSVDITQYLRRGTRNTLQYRLIMAADSGTSSRAKVQISLAKANASAGNTVELTGEYAPIEIKGIDGAKTYTVEVDVK